LIQKVAFYEVRKTDVKSDYARIKNDRNKKGEEIEN